MNAGATAGRIYDSLRHLIVNHGFRPGDRLDATYLAEKLASSVTPVRDALNMLTGEGLVETRKAGGFFLPSLDEPALQDMYMWEAQILRLALKTGHLEPVEVPAMRPKASYADRLDAVMLGIAATSHNVEHARALRRLGARLHAVRTLEMDVIDGAWGDLAHLEYAREIADATALRKLLQHYHHRCILASARLVRAVYRAR
ncbi:GntR family transcriptional regulator [Novosphingobium sp.]|uniref:GntR family transcriptional regulator n=1 Tax=Novosphingobium sp. TaxID=1874826 RepID=UPI0038BB31FD